MNKSNTLSPIEKEIGAILFNFYEYMLKEEKKANEESSGRQSVLVIMTISDIMKIFEKYKP